MENERPTLRSFFKKKDLFWAVVYGLVVWGVSREAGMWTTISIGVLFFFHMTQDVANRMMLFATELVAGALE